MNPSTDPTPAIPRPDVSLSDGAVHLRDAGLFGPGAERDCARFLARVLSVESVLSVSVDRSQNTAVIRHDAGPRHLIGFLEKLSRGLRDGVPLESLSSLPRGIRALSLTVHRNEGLWSTCRVVSDRAGRLRLSHERWDDDPVLSQFVASVLAETPGVSQAKVNGWSGNLEIRYDSRQIRVDRLVRLVEAAIEDYGGWGGSLPQPTKTRFTVANVNLGLSAAADFVAPMLVPMSAVVLIGSNLRTFRAAGLQIRARKFGLPVLYTTIVAATLASGQFFASALMFWLFKFWQSRLRHELATERRRFLDDHLPRPGLGRIVTLEGIEVMVPIDRLLPGDRVTVRADETVPIDGRVVEGEGIVDERGVRGLEGASRKRPPDMLLAGSKVLAGSFQLEVVNLGDQSRASAIGRAMVKVTSPVPGPLSPTMVSEKFADRTVGPTLATAGLGLLVGDLTAAGAILRPDYASGPGLAVPLETLHDAAQCARLGIVARAFDAFDRLADVDLIVIQDSPALWDAALEVRNIQTRLPEEELLRYAASAYRHLSDDRATALIEACRARRLHLLNLPPVEFEPGITIVHGKWRIRVRDQTDAAEAAGPLLVEVDGSPVGTIEFGRSPLPKAAFALRRIQESAQVPIVLISSRPEAAIAGLAAAIGVDAHQGSLSDGEASQLFRSFRDRGARVGFVADCRQHGVAAAEAHVAISLAGDHDLDSDPGALLVLQPGLERLADLWDIARSHTHRVRSTERFVLWPNLICVAGAFFLGATALTSVVVSNLGTIGLYGRALGSLRSRQPTRRGSPPCTRVPHGKLTTSPGRSS